MTKRPSEHRDIQPSGKMPGRTPTRRKKPRDRQNTATNDSHGNAEAHSSLHPHADGAATTTWRGITTYPEDRCSPYDANYYPYSQSVEPRIVDAQGGIYGPYTGA